MPRLNKELAEVVGALMGDGCLSSYWSRSENRQRSEIAFTGSKEEMPYYENFIQPLIQRNFGRKGYLYKHKDGYTRYHIKSKKIFDYFRKLGIPVGAKTSKMGVPKRITGNRDFAVAFTRGIMDTEGSIYRRYRKKYAGHPRIYNYLVLQLKMKSWKTVKMVAGVFDMLEIPHNRIIATEGCSVLRVTNQKAIEKFISEIGFNNQKHLDRLDRFLTNPF